MLLCRMLQGYELTGCESKRPTESEAANGRQHREIWSEQNYSIAQAPTGMMHGSHCKGHLVTAIEKMLTCLGE